MKEYKARAVSAPTRPALLIALEVDLMAMADAGWQLFESHTTDGTDGAGACRYELIYVREKDAEAVRRCPSPCARDRKVNVQGAAGAKQPCASCGKLTSYVETQGRA